MKIEDIRVPGKLTKKETELRVVFLEHVGVIPGGEKIKACISLAPLHNRTWQRVKPAKHRSTC